MGFVHMAIFMACFVKSAQNKSEPPHTRPGRLTGVFPQASFPREQKEKKNFKLSCFLYASASFNIISIISPPFLSARYSQPLDLRIALIESMKSSFLMCSTSLKITIISPSS